MKNKGVVRKMKNKKIKQIAIKIFCIILGSVAGFGVGFFSAKHFKNAGFKGIEWILLLIAIYVSFYLQIIFHEAGHLIFGVLSGYKFVSFRVNNFMIYKKQGKLHIGKYMIAGTGGQCLMSPPELVNGTMPYCLSNFGGVFMNLIVSMISLAIYILCDLGSLAEVFLISLIIIGVLFTFTNGIPMRLGGIDNDGYNAVSLGKEKEALFAFWLQLKVNELLTEGKRLKDMPEEWFEKPSEEGMKNTMIAAIEAMRCNRLLDQGAFEETNQAIESVIKSNSGMVGVQKMLLKLDQIYCEILGEHREEILNRMKGKELSAFMKSMKTFPSVVRTQYAYALKIEKDEKKAAKLKTQFVKIMEKHPYEGEIESEWELIRYCEENTEWT